MASELWRKILAAVKERRRFAWILLSQNAVVSRIDAESIYLEFVNAAAGRTYHSAGVDSVLERVIREDLALHWKVEIVGRNSMGDGTSESKESRVAAESTGRILDEWPDIPNSSFPRKREADPADIVKLWPMVLAAVKGRRRFTWLLLNEYASVDYCDGEILRLSFTSKSQRETFISSGSDSVLGKVLGEVFNVSWTIETVAE
ncbi:hypothetical protein ACFZCL_05645 [Streptomyces sp. NPDC008159]|uniref:hypothetical protein n=1 Tax=Streptomyces sp. NPDC008159 TaxID=3364817 RepID=UPI0036EBA997